jgi:DNA-binding CsgD family transcriptional regulator
VEVLGLLARGLTATEIAQRFVVSAKTVRNHVEHIYLKTGVTNRTGAVLFALDHGLVGSVERWGSHPMTVDSSARHDRGDRRSPK